MHMISGLPLAGLLVLAACGGGDSDAARAASGGSGDVVPGAAAGGGTEPRPGEYRATMELLEFDMPGITPEVRQMMMSNPNGFFDQAQTFCITEEDGAHEAMLQDMVDNDCTVESFDVSGNRFDGVMQCSGDDGMSGQIIMSGTTSATSYSMTMDNRQNLPGGEAVHMRMRMDAERIGDCAA